MKLWKAPVLYFGIALVLLVATVTIAPYLINWGNYRTAIEDYGRKLTGRQVTVAGDISGRFFPWPRISINNLRIGNPQGALSAELLTAERVDVRITLGSLINGDIKIETIDVVRPVLSIERMPDGAGNWRFAPDLSERTLRLVDRVRLDKIALTDGTVHLIDSLRKGRATIEHVNGTLAAPSVAGPWRMRAMATYRNREMEFGINTGTWRDNEPFKFGFQVSPRDGSGFDYTFDGSNDGTAIAGSLRIEPALQADGRSDPEGKLRPLVLAAKVKADFDQISLDKIEIAPRDDLNSANLLTGSAHVKLGSTIELTTDLAANRFDLDLVAGAGVKQILRENGGLAVVEQLMAALPENVRAQGSLRITSLIFGGKPLTGVKITLDATGDMLRVKEISAGLPGQARALFSGVFVMTEAGPQLSGDLAGEANDLREFVLWAMPDLRQPVEHLWTGSRGRFKVQTRLDAAAGYLRLQDADFQLDTSRGRGGLTLAFGDHPSAELRIDAPSLDFDPLIPNGLKAFTAAGEGWAELAARLPEFGRTRDLRLALQAGSLQLNGVVAEDVALDISADAQRMELKTIEIGNVGGAKLEVTGLLESSALGPSGSLAGHVTADDPRGLLQLLGFVAPDARPAWFAALGATNLMVKSDFKPDQQSQNITFSASGVSGDLNIEAKVAASGAPDLQTMELSGSGLVKSGDSAVISRLLGYSPVVSEPLPGLLSISATGSLAAGLAADIDLSLYGADLRYQGKVTGLPGNPALAGRLGLFAERPQAVYKALGIASDSPGVLSVETDVAAGNGAISLPALKGQFEGAPLAGFLKLSPGRKLDGELSIGTASLMRLMALAFMPLTGTAPDLEGPFAAGTPGGVTGEVWIKPQRLDVIPGVSATESQIGLSASPIETRIALFGKTDRGDVSIEAGAAAGQSGRAIDGRMTIPVDLAQVLKLESGEAVATGSGVISAKFTGGGMSPAAMIAGLKGAGTFDFPDVTLQRIDAKLFADEAQKAKTAEALRAALATLVSSGALPIGAVRGTITVVDGTASFLPVTVKGQDADLVLTPLAELQNGTIDLSAKLQLTSMPNLPGMEIAYAGPPLALKRSVDSAAIESYLGMKIVEQGIKELERIHAEQQRLLLEEEKARKEDAARLEAYLSQRRELRRRVREIQVHRKMQEEAAARAKIAAEKAAREAKAAAIQAARDAKAAAIQAAKDAKAAAQRDALAAEAAKAAAEQAQIEAEANAAREAMKAKDAADKAAVDALLATRAEMDMRIRELRVHRRMNTVLGKLADQPPKPPDLPAASDPPPQKKTKAERRKSKTEIAQDGARAPLVLVPPDPNFKPRKKRSNIFFDLFQ
ncbi:AsmA-like C-terminal region-containing protein [soil metagenome]